MKNGSSSARSLWNSLCRVTTRVAICSGEVNGFSIAVTVVRDFAVYTVQLLFSSLEFLVQFFHQNPQFRRVGFYCDQLAKPFPSFIVHLQSIRCPGTLTSSQQQRSSLKFDFLQGIMQFACQTKRSI